MQVPEEVLARRRPAAVRPSDLAVHLDPAPVSEVGRAASDRHAAPLFRGALGLVPPDEEEGRGEGGEDDDHGEQDDERRGERLGGGRVGGSGHREGLLELGEVGDGERPGLALHDNVAGRLQVHLEVVCHASVAPAAEAEVSYDGRLGRAREGHLSEDAVAAVGPPGEGDSVVASVKLENG